MSRLAGRGDGSVIGGVVGLRVEPGLLSLLAADRQIVLVTGTNGKTTTTRLITSALSALGQEVASNAFGANMEAGLAAALGQAPDAPYAVLEVDEKYVPAVLRATGARVVTLLNLSRDQMDRAAEIWLVARRWRDAFQAAPDCRVVANADDPLIVWAASGAAEVTWVAAGQRWHEDSWCCPRCGSHLRRDDLGWRCGECDFTRPAARWVLDGESVIDSTGEVTELKLALPGRANRSNAVVALAVAEVFRVRPAQALPKMRTVTSVAGRYTQVRRDVRGGELNVRTGIQNDDAGFLPRRQGRRRQLSERRQVIQRGCAGAVDLGVAGEVSRPLGKTVGQQVNEFVAAGGPQRVVLDALLPDGRGTLGAHLPATQRACAVSGINAHAVRQAEQLLLQAVVEQSGELLRRVTG